MKRTLLALLLVVSVFYLSSEARALNDRAVPYNDIAENSEKSPVAILSESGISDDLAERILEILDSDGVKSIDFARYETDPDGNNAFRVWIGTSYYDFVTFDGGVVSCTDCKGRHVFSDRELSDEYENYNTLLKYKYLRGITDPIKRGNTAAVYMFNLTPGSEYKIKVIYASGSESKAKGLEPKTAAEDGTVSWDWRVSSRTGAGTATIIVSGDGFSYSYKMEITE